MKDELIEMSRRISFTTWLYPSRLVDLFSLLLPPSYCIPCYTALT
jgi:hypothetical protein